MMKKFMLMLLVLAVAMLCAGSPAYAAQARYGLTFTPVTENTGSVLPAGTWVYGVGIYAATGASCMGLYDVATEFECTNATLSAPEVGQATQYASSFNWYEKPIYFTTAVSAVVGTGVGMIASGPAPTE